jgi:hypothetical protein
VDPPIEVESATWSAAGDLDFWVKERQDGWVAYGVQTVVRSGSEQLIVGRPKRVDSRGLSLSLVIRRAFTNCRNKLRHMDHQAAALAYASAGVPSFL